MILDDARALLHYISHAFSIKGLSGRRNYAIDASPHSAERSELPAQAGEVWLGSLKFEVVGIDVDLDLAYARLTYQFGKSVLPGK